MIKVSILIWIFSLFFIVLGLLSLFKKLQNYSYAQRQVLYKDHDLLYIKPGVLYLIMALALITLGFYVLFFEKWIIILTYIILGIGAIHGICISYQVYEASKRYFN